MVFTSGKGEKLSETPRMSNDEGKGSMKMNCIVRINKQAII